MPGLTLLTSVVASIVVSKAGTAMAVRVVQLLEDDNLRRVFGQQAADSARRCFDLERQADDWLM